MADENKSIQLDPTAHPGAMVCLCLSPEQQQALRGAAGLPDAEADHITLCYLGPDAGVLVEQKNAIVAGLTSLAECTAPLNGTIGGVARFAASESSDGQDVCVALYDCACLPDLRQAVCACCGGSPSEHGFIPHITLVSIAPGAPLPVEQLERAPLTFGAISLIWGGERIDLPLMGGTMAEGSPAEEALETPAEEAAEMKGAQVNAKDEGIVAKIGAAGGNRGDEILVWRHKETGKWAVSVGDWASSETIDAIRKVLGDDAEIDAEWRPGDDYEAVKTLGAERAAALIPEEDEADDDAAKDDTSARAMGGAVKSLADDSYRVRTRGIVWGGHDLEGDSLVRGQTDLGATRSFVGMPVYYDHAERGIKSQIGVVTDVDEDEQGITFDIELDRSRKYVEDIRALARQGVLGSSTSAIPHLVRRRRGVIKRWIAGEISLTPEPMEPRTHPAFAGKAVLQEETSMGEETKPNEAQTAGADVARLETEIAGLKATHADEVKSLRTALSTAEAASTALATEVKSVRTDLDAVRSLPAVKNRDPHAAAEALGGAIGGGMNALAGVPNGYHYFKALTMISYPGQPTKQTEYPEGIFGGFVKAAFMANKPSPAVQRDAIKALTDVYGVSMESDAAKALGTQAGVSGAFLIPEQFIPTLMMIAQQNDVLYGRTMVIPADGGEIVIPALDPSTAFAEGQSAYYGGVSISWGSDDADPAATEPKFKQVRLKTNSMKAFTRVKNALMMRSAIAIDAVVSNLLGGAIGRARDYAILRGTGVGQPLGVLNSPATIDVGGSAIDFATLTGMEDNVIPERDDNYVWIIHSKKRSAIWALQQTNNTLVTILPNLRDRPSTVLLGRPIAWTDKTPFASGDVSNTVNLIDPSMIVVAEFQGLALAVSDQARFEQDETVIRAIMSLDAQPWLINKVAVTSTPDYVSGFITI